MTDPETPEGRTYGPLEFQVRDEDVEAFLDATTNPNPVYATPNSPVPPMFIARVTRDALAECIFDEDLNIDVTRLIHGGQDLRFHHPMYVGDTLRTTATVEELAPRGDNLVLTVETRTTNEAEEPCVVGTWTLVVRGGAKGGT